MSEIVSSDSTARLVSRILPMAMIRPNWSDSDVGWASVVIVFETRMSASGSKLIAVGSWMSGTMNLIAARLVLLLVTYAALG